MASHAVSTSTLALATAFLIITLITPSHALDCKSQKLTNNKVYSNCTDLPTLSSFLHYTYNSSNSSLSVAFFAAPASSAGWIGWGLNPTGSGMIGAQALIAFEVNGSMTVKTYNLSSYGGISEAKLSFEVYEMKAEKSGGLMQIYATVAVPKDNATVNQVWQVGSVVSGGFPMKHAITKENLSSKGTIELVASGEKNGTGTGTGADEKSGSEKMSRSATVWFVCFGSFVAMAVSLLL